MNLDLLNFLYFGYNSITNFNPDVCKVICMVSDDVHKLSITVHMSSISFNVRYVKQKEILKKESYDSRVLQS